MQSPNVESALTAIRAKLETMSEAERKIAEYVLSESKKTLHYNVAELAKQSGSSRAAVVRFCKRIGAAGFSDFKLSLARDVFQDRDERFLPDLELESGTVAEEVVRDVIDIAQRSLSRLSDMVDPRLVDAAAERIRHSTMTALFGMGASGIVASDFHQKLLRIGLPATFTADADLQITAACALRPSDTAFVVSYSGESASMVESARQAKGRGATLVTLTMEGNNTIRSLGDIPLVVPASERIYRRGAETSRINQLTVIDILYAIIISRDLDSSIAAMELSMEATHRSRG